MRHRTVNPIVAQIVQLWNEDHTAAQIAAILAIPSGTVSSHLARARSRLGAYAVPHRPRGPQQGRTRTSTPLDRLRKLGDTVILSKAIAGSRQNVHQNAETRGWKVRMRSDGDSWIVTAIGLADKRVPV